MNSEEQKIANQETSFLTENKELEKTIETIIKRDTPDREVYFDNKTELKPSGEKIHHYKIYTKNSRDPFLLLLDQGKEHEGIVNPNIYHLFELGRNKFLKRVKDELNNNEKVETNRYLVKWEYTNKEGEKERTSHFYGKSVEDVVNKIKNSIPSEYDYKIMKIELLPES